MRELACGVGIAGANALHLDYIQNETEYIPDEWAAAAASTALPLDVHWITATPDVDFIQTLNEMNVDSLAIQSTKLTDELVAGLQEFEGQKGVGICISDGSESVFPFLDLIDYVLLMSGEPGRSGGAFDRRCLQCIVQLRQKRPDIGIHVDGGITPQAMNLLRMFDVNMVVCGSYLSTQETIQESICMLRFGHLSYELEVRHFMVNRGCVPTVDPDDSFTVIMDAMSQGKRGAVVVVAASGALKGLITDGDIRRGLTRYGTLAHNYVAANFMNTTPFCVSESMDILSFSKAVSDIGSAVIVVPVFAQDGTTLSGIVDLHSNLFF